MNATNEVEKSERRIRRIHIVFGAIGLVAILSWTCSPLWLRWWLSKLSDGQVSHEALGQMGDLFGAINALFSGFALAGAAYAILLQREDLRIQQEEFRQQTREFKLQNQILSDNRDLTQRAISDQTLAMLLQTLTNELNRVEFEFGRTRLSGAAGLRELWIIARLNHAWRRVPDKNGFNEERNTARTIYDDLFTRQSGHLMGDVESVVRIWAHSATLLASDGISPGSLRGRILREFHPKELGFVLYIVAMVRAEVELINAAEQFNLLERCVREDVLHSRHLEFLRQLKAESTRNIAMPPDSISPPGISFV